MNSLEFTDALDDGWLDPGKNAPLRSVEESRQPAAREVILIDRNADAALAALIDGPIAAIRTVRDPRARTVLLALLVCRALPSAHGATLQHALDEAREKSGCNVIPIMTLSAGTCRHRCPLFKYLADRVSIQCRLVNGISACSVDDSDAGSHCCCIVRVNQKTFYMVFTLLCQI